MPSRHLTSSIWCSRHHPFLHIRCTHSFHSSHSRAPPPSSEAVYLQDPDLENLENYRPTGFHPTSIGAILKDGRYKLVHKLGFGGYSTIWLARDLHRRRYVALKLQRARASSRNKESAILISLRDPSSHPGTRFVPSLLDDFTVTGPNGTHLLCLVSEPNGPNVAVSKEDAPDWMFPVKSARSIAAQLIMGLSYLHSRGICHGGMFARCNRIDAVLLTCTRFAYA